MAGIGATGRFPDGKLSADDDGELRFMVAARPGQVTILFGTPVKWVALPPETAETLAQTLLDCARKARDGKPP